MRFMINTTFAIGFFAATELLLLQGYKSDYLPLAEIVTWVKWRPIRDATSYSDESVQSFSRFTVCKKRVCFFCLWQGAMAETKSVPPANDTDYEYMAAFTYGNISFQLWPVMGQKERQGKKKVGWTLIMK